MTYCSQCWNFKDCSLIRAGVEDCHEFRKYPEDEDDFEQLVENELSSEQELEAWQEQLIRVQNNPCFYCGADASKRHVDYNDHDGKYYTYDTVCDECGHTILSLLD